MDKTLGVGIIGCGNISATYLKLAPLFRGIDLALQTLDILPPALAGVRFRPDKIKLDPSIHAAERAYELVVREGIPFREAYRRVARTLDAE